MKNLPVLVTALLAVAVLAFLFRLWHLEQRPMHHDEANQAVRTGILQETGVYRYDPEDHHGPSLYYLSLPVAWLHSGRDFASTTASTFRLVPVLFGAGLIPLLLLLRGAMKPPALLLAGILTAISPAMVFYSRFYIQEMLLVFFTFAAIGCAWRYFSHPSAAWAVATGVCLGLMFATKETSVLAYACMGLGLVAVMAADRPDRRGGRSGPGGVRVPLAHLVLAGLSALLPAGILFTSFLEHPGGLLDIVWSAQIYLSRGLGESLHVHPWYFYLKILLYTHEGRGLVWTEGFIVLLAAVGAFWAWVQPLPSTEARFARFLSVYTIALTFLYSVLPHKTPWCLISFLHGMILLAALAAVEIWRKAERPRVRVAVALLLAAGLFHLGWLSWQGNFRHDTDPRNPYVYSQTSADFLNLVERLEQISRVAPEGRRLFVQVVADPYSTWPLPWYLRSFKQVGYWEDAASALKTPLPDVVITTPALEPSLSSRLAKGFQAEYYGLRPSVLLLVYIRQDLWDQFIKTRTLTAAGK